MYCAWEVFVTRYERAPGATIDYCTSCVVHARSRKEAITHGKWKMGDWHDDDQWGAYTD